MGERAKSRKLRKELGLFDVYAIATGATLSSGFFLLPGLAAEGAGEAMPLSYMVAAIFLVPGFVSMVELATAMPKAGGMYYFLDRSLGPLLGTIGGFGTWIALVLKSAFALIGVGAYVHLFAPGLAMAPVAVGLAMLFGVVNIVGAKKTTTFQSVLVVTLLVLLVWFTGVGLAHVEPANLVGVFGSDGASVLSTAGLVVVSYLGLTKVASVAEEVEDPERNLPLGMFLAFGTAAVVYVVGTGVMLGVVGSDVLARGGGDLTPVATVAHALVGPWGTGLMTVAAVLAFSSVANAGILSASRYPLAMGRDRLLPTFFGGIGAHGTPVHGIYATVVLIVVAVLAFDPSGIAKLASAFQLVMFALACAAVVVLRESGIESYDPGFRSPLYPTLQVVGIFAPFFLIVEMGFLPTLFTAGLITCGALWYTYYARPRVAREGAIFHVFERLGRQRYAGLDPEFREIMKERGVRDADPFDEIVAAAGVVDLEGPVAFDDLAVQGAELLARGLAVTPAHILVELREGTQVGRTPVSHGAALPHLHIAGLDRPRMVLARVRGGVSLEHGEGGAAPDQPTQAVFFMASPEHDASQHLRLLAQVARRVDAEGFMGDWLAAEDEQELKEVLLRDERFLALELEDAGPTRALVGLALREAPLPSGTLIALVKRGDEIIVPRGETRLQEADRLTVIGDPDGITALRERYRIAHRSTAPDA